MELEETGAVHTFSETEEQDSERGNHRVRNRMGRSERVPRGIISQVSTGEFGRKCMLFFGVVSVSFYAGNALAVTSECHHY
jgi:hypothetical protein